MYMCIHVYYIRPDYKPVGQFGVGRPAFQLGLNIYIEMYSAQRE